MTSLFVREIPREEHLAQLRLSSRREPSPDPRVGRREARLAAGERGLVRGRGDGRDGARPVPAAARDRRFLAYLPDGPAIDWRTPRLERWLDPLVAHLERIGAFSVRIGPPLVVRHWDAATVTAGIADPDVRHLRDLPAAGIDGLALDAAERLRRLGWRQCEEDDGSGFGLGQPRYGC